MKDLKVLYVPLQYFFGKDFGSEIICAYELFSRIQHKYPFTSGIAYSNLVSGKNFPNLIYSESKAKPYYYGFLENFKFILFYTFQGIKLIFQKKPNVLHHVFPFAIGNTFNPLFLLFGNRLKKVIGPIQTTPRFYNKDVKLNSKISSFFNDLVYIILPFFAYIIRVLSIKTLERADRIIALNEMAKEELVEFGVPEEKISVIPIGIDIQKFNFAPNKYKDDEAVNLITVGYLIERKGTDLLIKALEKVTKKHQNVRLMIVGDGPQKKVLEDLTNTLNLQNHVQFKGFVSYKEIVELYRKAHIYVSMSRAETWGQSYIDSMACGVPIIVSETTGSKSIVKDGVFGFFVKQEDYLTLADKVNLLIENKKLLEEMGRKARSEVENKYDWGKAIIPKYLEIYSQII